MSFLIFTESLQPTSHVPVDVRNILSSGAGVHINHLTTLFMRPNTVTSATSGNKVGCGNNTGKF
jgi:hypothetical protein